MTNDGVPRMQRHLQSLSPVLLAVTAAWLAPAGPARADAFDHYVNPVLARAVERKAFQEVKRLTPALILDNDRVLKGIPAAFVVVKTNKGRYAKLLVRDAAQKVDAGR